MSVPEYSVGSSSEAEGENSSGSPLLSLAMLGFILILMGGCLGLRVIEPGNRGVLYNVSTGIQTDVSLDEGAHIIWPVYEQMFLMSVQVQKSDFHATASSKDLQQLAIDISLNYHLDPDKVGFIYKEVGTDYNSKLIGPSVQESIKAVSANYNATELIEKRPEVKQKTKALLIERLSKFYILVDDLSITDINFSPEFKEAIEAKQIAEQEALQKSYELQKAQVDAEIAIAKAEGKKKARISEAQGESEAQRLLQQSISPAVIELKRIEKWDGNLPGVVNNEKSIDWATGNR